MLEKPNLPDELITACLRTEYGVNVTRLTFLPLGADLNAAVFHAIADGETAYFLKLRSGPFADVSVALPEFLSDHHIKQIIAPLTTRTGQLWASPDTFKAILYPFIDGRNGYEVAMSEQHCCGFGSALRKIHAIELPVALGRRIRRETYTPRWRDTVTMFLKRVEDDVVLRSRCGQIGRVLEGRARLDHRSGRTRGAACSVTSGSAYGIRIVSL